MKQEVGFVRIFFQNEPETCRAMRMLTLDYSATTSHLLISPSVFLLSAVNCQHKQYTLVVTGALLFKIKIFEQSDRPFVLSMCTCFYSIESDRLKGKVYYC